MKNDIVNVCSHNNNKMVELVAQLAVLPEYVLPPLGKEKSHAMTSLANLRIIFIESLTVVED